ncbi:MAG: hypothetical protein N3A66_03520, partial [Planctomycetota bacterium]|nr:hypothetical protein [Planctomycetota bacterium]
ALYEEALKPLRRISMYCAASPHHGWAEATLIETLMRLGRYSEAAAVADGFLRREDQRHPHWLRVLVARAECARQSGDLETAADLFRQVLENAAAEA